MCVWCGGGGGGGGGGGQWVGWKVEEVGNVGLPTPRSFE